MLKEDPRRHKVNFMLKQYVLQDLKQSVPSGQRSDFVNKAIEQALVREKRMQAFHSLDEIKKAKSARLSTEELIQMKNEGRE